MFEVHELIESIDKFKDARDACKNDPDGDIESKSWTNFKNAEDALYNAFKAAVKSVLFEA